MDDNSKFWKSKSFKKLQKQWYKKLEKSEFQDAETDEDHLRDWSYRFARKKSLDTWEAKQEYYYIATHFLNDYQFANNIDRAIWEYHAEGIQYPAIAQLLQKVRIKMTRDMVVTTVRRLRATMYSLYGYTND